MTHFWPPAVVVMEETSKRLVAVEQTKRLVVMEQTSKRLVAMEQTKRLVVMEQTSKRLVVNSTVANNARTANKRKLQNEMINRQT